MSGSVPLVAEAEGLTADWLSLALGARVDSVTLTPVGTGQIGTCHRLELHGDPSLPASVLAKLPAVDPAARAMLANPYRTELRFYREIAPTLAVRVPAVHHADGAEEGGDFVLLLEDLAPAVQGDQIGGCTIAQVEDAVVNLAGLHGPRWCDPTLLDIEGLSINGPEDAALMAELFGPAVDLFVDNLADQLSDDDVATVRAVPEVIERWALARAERFGPVHGDYRLDNLLFPPDGGPGVVAVDWQTLSLALPARDLAYAVATSLDPESRRGAEEALVAAYHRALVGQGVTSYSRELCWDDYRFAMLQVPLVCVFGQAYGTRTERGDRMFAVMTARACAAIRELETIALV
ncbi:phosphotransferase [Nocardioides sp. WS12]|uniref:phosphotransferase family protein n=1 Tax=Nocardioides sp. WS12 TaxID=2486272 RepID=UPI0015FDEB8B|nr:phosphotransferase [Nocardioides sp. WS12]